MSTVERAIILAAGEGRRMRPVTLDTPKSLVRVNGVRLIDTVIQGLTANGIHEIHIVVGWRKEQFQALVRDYPGIELIENPWYGSSNNISSLYAAREYLRNVIITDADLLIRDPRVLAPEFQRSGYNAVWTDESTSEWLLTVEEGVVSSCSRTGGAHGWQLYSVSRWDEVDGARLRRHLETEFEQRRNWGIYWDDVALFCHPEAYQLGVSPMDAGGIIEIDTLAELAALDSSYRRYLKEDQHEA